MDDFKRSFTYRKVNIYRTSQDDYRKCSIYASHLYLWLERRPEMIPGLGLITESKSSLLERFSFEHPSCELSYYEKAFDELIDKGVLEFDKNWPFLVFLPTYFSESFNDIENPNAAINLLNKISILQRSCSLVEKICFLFSKNLKEKYKEWNKNKSLESLYKKVYGSEL